MRGWSHPACPRRRDRCEVKIFTAATNTIANGPVNSNLQRVSVSGNASRDSSKAFVYRDDGNQPRIVVYDLDGALLPGALYPVVQTINLADSPNASSDQYFWISMTTTPDDKTLFVSGNARILVVPVN